MPANAILLDPETAERFWRKVDKSGDCWQWLSGVDRSSYGRFRLGRSMRLAHRVAYVSMVGPIPEGLVIDHLCRNRSCVNPAHMEPVTRGENALRGETIAARNAAVTQCPAGHLYDETNTHIRPSGARYCRPCNVARVRELRTRRVA